MPHALITGGTSGIGAGIARTLLAAGYRVTATGLSEAELAAVPAADNLTLRQLDVTDDRSIAGCFEEIEALDALVNCAGMIMRGGAEYEIENFSRVIDVNLTGTMRMCVAAKPLLTRSRGAIVNTASMLSFFGGPMVPAYTASKGGVAQLTKALAAAWAADGIRVNAVAPGWVETELTRNLVADESRSAAILARTPMGRWGKPDDIGGAVLFLVSQQASFITGAILPVDGGYAAV
ncbi:2-deoxy-D-gluconate 3-dehydrogenase [Phyllobacterium phragmitis]|uniref:2-deoxy-D-gluconate 3-dehydrogenase n=1 Tax=Phyllobacterium phragmitis TaxID=2670329 RepID=A0A2S9IK93_9HYPH|nr:SDR family oxidoreductase [Phyllobacterium phragmitis]PRD40929.1 2-deoxy-D-gluconate 3-dehydrogenase [Phyllobacterium phragmitis]